MGENRQQQVKGYGGDSGARGHVTRGAGFKRKVKRTHELSLGGGLLAALRIPLIGAYNF